MYIQSLCHQSTDSLIRLYPITKSGQYCSRGKIHKVAQMPSWCSNEYDEHNIADVPRILSHRSGAILDDRRFTTSTG